MIPRDTANSNSKTASTVAARQLVASSVTANRVVAGEVATGKLTLPPPVVLNMVVSAGWNAPTNTTLLHHDHVTVVATLQPPPGLELKWQTPALVAAVLPAGVPRPGSVVPLNATLLAPGFVVQGVLTTAGEIQLWTAGNTPPLVAGPATTLAISCRYEL